MGIIPLRAEGHSPTLVTNRARFSVDGYALLLLGVDETQLVDGEKNNQSNASYDLRIGPAYRDHREGSRAKREIQEDGVLKLRPGAAVIVQAEESVALPRTMYGSIAPKVGLLQAGLSNTFAKVDPGYDGPLLVTLFNLGKRTVSLKRREPFCALTLHRVEDGARIYSKPGKQLEGTPPAGKGWWRSTHDWLAFRHVEILLALVVVELLRIVTEARLPEFLHGLRHGQ